MSFPRSVSQLGSRLLLTLVAGLFLADLAVAVPITLDDIREFRRERKTHRDILAVIEADGLGFDVDDGAARQLRRLGFTRTQINVLQKMPLAEAGGAAEEAVDDPAAKIDADEAAGGAKLELDPQAEAEHRLLADQIDRMIKASDSSVSKHLTDYSTIITSKKLAPQFVGDVKRLEEMIKKRFPEPIAGGKDPRAANLALLPTRYQYEKWVKAMFKVFKEDGITFMGGNPEQMALQGESFFTRGIYSVCLEKMQMEEARRRVSFAVGFQAMNQLSRYTAPDVLATGFGNYTEVMMFAQPTMMVKSGYIDREIAGQGNAWAGTVQERFAQRQIGSIQNVLAYSTESMNLPHYAEAWSLTSLLASDPKKFAALVTKLREGEPKWEAIQEVYEVDEKKLLSTWAKFARTQR